jgi:hypothetical protein
MAKAQHLPAVLLLLALESLLALELLLGLQVLLESKAIERINQEPQTKKSAPSRLARKLPPPKQA